MMAETYSLVGELPEGFSTEAGVDFSSLDFPSDGFCSEFSLGRLLFPEGDLWSVA